MIKAQSISILLLTGICLFGIVRPLLRSQIILQTPSLAENQWPSHFMGVPLIPVPLTESEVAFYRNFPGSAAQFQADTDRLILRRVEQATRKLHPAKDCFQGMGYTIEAGGLRRDSYERIWRTFSAIRKEEVLEVHELIIDDTGNHWSDVSAWYWAVLLKRTKGPWTSFVRVRQLTSQLSN